MQWHAPDLAPIHGQFGPLISDDRGDALTARSAGAGPQQPAWPWSLPLPAWSPWHPPTVARGFAVLGPLPATARVAILRWPYTTPPEIVRVPIDFHALARRRTTYSGARATAAGVTVTLHDLNFTHMTYASTSPPNSTVFIPSGSAWLSDVRGHRQTVASGGSTCGDSGGSMTCSGSMTFTPQRAGAHMTLTILYTQSLGLSGTRQVLHGPWRFSFVIP